jgi:tRNA(Arg) A34 adenosine deaminase TadA
MVSPSALTLSFEVPAFIDELAVQHGPTYATPERRMRLVCALAEANVEQGGGPFGAAVFAGSTLVAAGVNCVLSSGFSIAHAEIVAIMRAQRALAQHAFPGPFSLVSSAEPCCQCFGALVWSGVDELVYGASREDVEAIGFDEGPKPERWADVLRAKGIAVVEELARADAKIALARYADRGGPIYGLRHPSVPKP